MPDPTPDPRYLPLTPDNLARTSPAHVPLDPSTIPGPLGQFLAEQPEYVRYVFKDQEHGGWGMPGWVANVFYRWNLAQLRKPLSEETPEERAGREGRN